jgi:L-amino acid N-acyltransferase YncA
MGIMIREATINDVYGIAKVHVDSWNTTYKDIVPDEYLKSRTYKWQEERWLKRYFENKNTKECLYVAVNMDGEVVGFACGSSQNEDIEFKGTINAIYISDNNKTQGIGKQLVKKIVEKLAKDEVEKMIIWAFEKNPSCKFYEKIGGIRIRKEIVNIGGKELVEVGFCWSNLEQLLSEL